MFKKQLGISVYPEKETIENTKKYILDAKNAGFTKMFISFLQFPTVAEFKKVEKIYLDIIKFANELDFYIVADIMQSSLEATSSSIEDLSFFKNAGISCLRLDSPLMPKTVADITHDIDLDIQLNLSNNDSFIDNILDFKPVEENLFGCHNFYPQKNTGLGWNFFVDSTKRYLTKGISTAAFIGSDFGTNGPQKYSVGKVVTIENHRNKPIRTQAKELIFSNLISDIYIGNQRATIEELNDVSTIDRKNLELDIELFSDLSEVENKILFEPKHFSRGDINENYIRSTMSRVYFKNEKDILPKNVKKTFNFGDIVIINNNNKNYQKELIIVTKDNFSNLDNTGNLVGKVKKYDLDLLKMVLPWTRFKFRVVE